ncbi:hypothetical protein B4U80_04417, partial [Leptotrombidium deliense]
MGLMTTIPMILSANKV